MSPSQSLALCLGLIFNLTEHEMQEYVFYENVGPEADDMFRGLAMSSGGVISNAVV